MIIGECPYEDCGEMLIVAFTHIKANYTKYAKSNCDKCNREHWIKLSRVDPERWTIEEFEKLYEINEETKELRKRNEI